MLFVVAALALFSVNTPAVLAGPCCSACQKEHTCTSPIKETPAPETKASTAKYPKLLVFVSFAMPTSTLKELGRQVNTLGGAVVFRGLVEGSFRKTAEKLKEVGCEALIDPTLFEAYSVTAVPTFILRKAATDEAEQKIVFDRISGNVSLHYVLEEFATKGDVREKAVALLQKLKEER